MQRTETRVHMPGFFQTSKGPLSCKADPVGQPQTRPRVGSFKVQTGNGKKDLHFQSCFLNGERGSERELFLL